MSEDVTNPQTEGAGSDPPPPATPDEQVQKLTEERDQYLDRWQRTAADFENYRRRVQREQDQERLYRSLPLARDLLPALDNLARTLEAAKAGASLDALVQGVAMVQKQFEDALSRHAIVPIPAVGMMLDPNLHEVLQQVPSADQPPLTVLQEVERGYQLMERVVRPSKVIVAGPPAEPAPQ